MKTPSIRIARRCQQLALLQNLRIKSSSNDMRTYSRPWPYRFWQKHQEHIIRGIWYVLFAVLAAVAVKMVA